MQATKLLLLVLLIVSVVFVGSALSAALTYSSTSSPPVSSGEQGKDNWYYESVCDTSVTPSGDSFQQMEWDSVNSKWLVAVTCPERSITDQDLPYIVAGSSPYHWAADGVETSQYSSDTVVTAWAAPNTETVRAHGKFSLAGSASDCGGSGSWQVYVLRNTEAVYGPFDVVRSDTSTYINVFDFETQVNQGDKIRFYIKPLEAGGCDWFSVEDYVDYAVQTTQQPICGNSKIEAGEVCDDGNTNGADGCSGACQLEAGYSCSGEPAVCVKLCGNRVIDSGEGCDGGLPAGVDCVNYVSGSTFTGGTLSCKVDCMFDISKCTSGSACTANYFNDCDSTDGCGGTKNTAPHNSCDLSDNVACGTESVCDGVDNNCDTKIDENNVCGTATQTILSEHFEKDAATGSDYLTSAGWLQITQAGGSLDIGKPLAGSTDSLAISAKLEPLEVSYIRRTTQFENDLNKYTVNFHVIPVDNPIIYYADNNVAFGQDTDANGVGIFRCFGPNGNAYNTVPGATQLRWYKISIEVDPVAGESWVYVDGTKSQASCPKTNTFYTPADTISIGDFVTNSPVGVSEYGTQGEFWLDDLTITQDAPLTCPAQTVNCNNNLVDGCETNTGDDTKNCGTCGNACSFGNALATCVASTCVLASCDASFWDLNQNVLDGCEYQCEITNNGVEIVDGLDNNCDGQLLLTESDNDGDGYSEFQGDCDDNPADDAQQYANNQYNLDPNGNGNIAEHINPGAIENKFDSVDNNCDGQVDEGAFCGDGSVTVAKGEQCDYGSALDLTFSDRADCDGTDSGAQACTSAVCGDGYVNSAANEFCDDSNLNAGDGCGNTCAVEAGYSCAGTVSVCTLIGKGKEDTFCGNNIVEVGEECDDGNSVGGDGCSATCAAEAPPVCNEQWSCTDWSACSEAGQQTRTCTDTNNCGTTNAKPAESQACTPVCKESWSCAAWSDCTTDKTGESMQARVCTDANSCGTILEKPVAAQGCTPSPPNCDPDWSCADWSACPADSVQVRTCNDKNNCGTTSGKPAEQQACTPECNEQWSCTDWTACAADSKQTRACTDTNNCGTISSKPVVQQACVYVPECGPEWICSDWSECSTNSKQTRICTDKNGCGMTAGKLPEEQACTYQPPAQCAVNTDCVAPEHGSSSCVSGACQLVCDVNYKLSAGKCELIIVTTESGGGGGVQAASTGGSGGGGRTGGAGGFETYAAYGSALSQTLAAPIKGNGICEAGESAATACVDCSCASNYACVNDRCTFKGDVSLAAKQGKSLPKAKATESALKQLAPRFQLPVQVIYLMLAVAAALLAVASYKFYFKPKFGLPAIAEAHGAHTLGAMENAKSFIAHALAEGHGIHDVRNHLIESGWHPDDVHRAISENADDLTELQHSAENYGVHENSAATKQLRAYVKDGLARGYTEAQIKAIVLANGWPERVVDQVVG